jgi:hypothetical protein
MYYNNDLLKRLGYASSTKIASWWGHGRSLMSERFLMSLVWDVLMGERAVSTALNPKTYSLRNEKIDACEKALRKLRKSSPELFGLIVKAATIGTDKTDDLQEAEYFLKEHILTYTN